MRASGDERKRDKGAWEDASDRGKAREKAQRRLKERQEKITRRINIAR